MISATSLSSGCSVGFLRTRLRYCPGLQSFSLHSVHASFLFSQSSFFDRRLHSRSSPTRRFQRQFWRSLSAKPPTSSPHAQGILLLFFRTQLSPPSEPQCITCPPASDRKKVWGIHFPLHFISDREAKPAPIFKTYASHQKQQKQETSLVVQGLRIHLAMQRRGFNP